MSNVTDLNEYRKAKAMGNDLELDRMLHLLDPSLNPKFDDMIDGFAEYLGLEKDDE